MQSTLNLTQALSLSIALVLATACAPASDQHAESDTETAATESDLLSKYTSVTLTTEAELTDAHRQMIPLLIDAANEMDAVFWQQAYGDRDELLGSLTGADRQFAEINYGPWDRLDGNAPFVDGVEAKPAGANFYPADLSKEEFNAHVEQLREAGDNAQADQLEGLYALVRRNDEGGLSPVPYSQAYAEEFGRAAAKLREAAALAEDEGLESYLNLRADALMSDEYFESDVAWMAMKDNLLDVVIGPIENYEDQLFGYKTAASAYVLIKDVEWSERLERYAALLPELQRNLPVPAEYRAETPGSESQLNAYDILYYAGDSNAGSKTIAINLPNDERVQLNYGTRRLQLKNSVRAKFERILLPISKVLIAEDQRNHITFDAFFANTMFHEVAHGLGIKNTITGNGPVRQAMQERASALEEGKADVLGLFMETQLAERGELGDNADIRDNMVTFVASIFRSIRFGSTSAHGTANLIRFNYFLEEEAFTRDEASGTYRIDFDATKAASNKLAGAILRLQGDGDYEAASQFVERYAVVGDQLQADLDRVAAAGIPVDIVFEQGLATLGL